MILSRRAILNYLYATGLSSIASPGMANISFQNNIHLQNFFKFSIGNIKITVVSDGSFTLPLSAVSINAPEEEIKKHLRKYHMPDDSIHRETNLVVIEVGNKRLLVDVGSGSRFIGNTGRLFENLALAEIEPDSITHVFLTHAHPDHVLGIRDDFDEPILPNAEFIISKNEYEWWTKKNRINEVEDSFQQMVLYAVNSLGALSEITLHSEEKEILPGVYMLDTSGHSPGHTSLFVQSQGSKLLICGDSLQSPNISLIYPDWTPDTDMDPIKAVETRKKVLSLLTNEKMALLGFHFPFPGVGHVITSNGSYQFLPESIRW